jgi:hypothetical protein
MRSYAISFRKNDGLCWSTIKKKARSILVRWFTRNKARRSVFGVYSMTGMAAAAWWPAGPGRRAFLFIRQRKSPSLYQSLDRPEKSRSELVAKPTVPVWSLVDVKW